MYKFKHATGHGTDNLALFLLRSTSSCTSKIRTPSLSLFSELMNTGHAAEQVQQSQHLKHPLFIAAKLIELS